MIRPDGYQSCLTMTCFMCCDYFGLQSLVKVVLTRWKGKWWKSLKLSHMSVNDAIQTPERDIKSITQKTNRLGSYTVHHHGNCYIVTVRKIWDNYVNCNKMGGKVDCYIWGLRFSGNFLSCPWRGIHGPLWWNMTHWPIIYMPLIPLKDMFGVH